MSYETKTTTEIKNQIIEQMRDGIVRIEREQYTFDQNTATYVLSGSTTTTPNVVEIISVEGTDEDGNWVPPTGTFNGISAWTEGSRGQIAEGSAAMSGAVENDEPTINYYMYWSGTEQTINQDTSVYDGDYVFNAIKWNNASGYRPKDGSIFKVTYKVYDSTVQSSLNNFSDGTVVTSLVEAIASYLHELDSNNYTIFKNSFVRTATGDALDELAYPWGLTRTAATKSTGYVYVTNSGSDTTVTTSYRCSIADRSLVYEPLVEVDIASGATEAVEVRAVATGKSYNVAPTTINRIWTDTSLATQVSDLTCSNPSTHLGSTNLFNNGADQETDEQLRTRIYRASKKQGSATYSAIEAAVEDIDGISDCKVYDLENKPYIAANQIHVFVVGDSKLITNSALIDTVEDTVSSKRPVGTRYQIYQPMLKWVYLEIDLTPDSDWWANRTTLNTSVENAIDDYIDTLKVGEDVVYSQIIEEGMGINGVYALDIDDFDISTYSYTPYGLTYSIDLQTSGTASYAHQFQMGTKSYKDIFTYSGAGAVTMSGTQISQVSRATPTVFRAKQDNDGVWIRDPLYAQDFYSTHDGTTITITSGSSGSADPYLTSGTDTLIFNYENYDYTDIDAVLLNVSGTTGDALDVYIFSGTDAGPSGSALESGSHTLTTTTAQNIYVELASRLTLADPTAKHWVVISGSAFSGSNTYVGTDTDGNVPWTGEYAMVWDEEAGPAAWALNTNHAKFSVMMPISGTNNATIDNVIYKSEVAILYDIVFTNSAKE